MVCLRNMYMDTLHKGDNDDDDDDDDKVMIGATGNISKSPRQYLRNIPGKHEIKELQKNSHTRHCTHTMDSAIVKLQNISHG